MVSPSFLAFPTWRKFHLLDVEISPQVYGNRTLDHEKTTAFAVVPPAYANTLYKMQNKNTISKWSLCLLFMIGSFFLLSEKIYAESQPFYVIGTDLYITGQNFNNTTETPLKMEMHNAEYPNENEFSGFNGGTGWTYAYAWYVAYGCQGINASTTIKCNLNNQPFSEASTGTYWFLQGNGTATSTWYNLNFDGTTWTGGSFIDNTTGIKFFDPSNGETVASSTSNTLYVDFFLTEEDYSPDSFLRIKYVRKQDLQATVANQDLLWTTLDLNDIITSGYHSVATTTGSLGLDGTYYFKAELRKNPTWWSTALSWFNPFTNRDPDIITSSSTTFIYGEMTGFDRYVASSTESFNNFVASSTLSIEKVKESCNPLSGFDLLTCLSGLFIPSSGDISNAVDQFKTDISTHFPLGYFSDFINIISTTTTGELTVIDAELPEALGLGKPTIRLDLAHSLDFILNATTSEFSFSSSTGASSTETFYETTSYYWNILVYVLTLFYLLSRLIGQAIIPRIK